MTEKVSEEAVCDKITACIFMFNDLLSAVRPFYDSFDKATNGEKVLSFTHTDIEILLDTYRVSALQQHEAYTLMQEFMEQNGEEEMFGIQRSTE